MTSITPRASDVISQTMTASMTSNVRRTSGVGSTPPPSGAQSSTSSTWLTEVAALPAPLCLTSDLLRTVCLTRERLSEWHQRFRSRLFPLIVGFHVRCRQEDTADGQCHYRVGYIKAIRADWSIELDPKPFQGLTGTEKEVTCAVASAQTNYDCVSNSRMTEEEYKIFVQSVAPSTTAQHALLLHVVRMRERLHMIECILMKDPEYPPKKKSLNEGKPLASGSMCSDTPSCKPSSSKSESDGKASHTAVKSYVFSTNVLLLSEDGSVGSGPCSMTVPVTELLRNAIGVSGALDPDTPRATNPSGGIPPGKPMSTSSHFRGREPEDKVASDTTSVLLTDLERYIASPTLPQNNDTWRLYHSVLAAGRSSGFTSFRYADPMGVAQMTLQVLNLAKETLSNESLYHNIASPVYVFGDIHGNFVDLQFFLSRLVTFDDIALRYGSHNLLFLGDYVDRGTCSYECIILLLILKVINPKKVVLLRGNHESPEVNGDLDCYGYSSFKYQCMDRFGRERGLEIWSRFNDVFAHFPLCASIDQRIFCVHGGLPFYAGGEDHRLEILKSPSFPRFPQVQCDVPTQRELRVMVNDLLWSDPAMRGTTLDEHGFGPNPRGPDIRSFGSRAVDEFCEHFGFQFIFRAHQEKADGLRLSDSARVLTIFSTSDYAGHQNGAGCIFVHDGKIRLVIKKPKNSATSVEVGSGGGATGGGISPNQRSTGIAASNLRGRGSPSATVSNSNALGTIITTPRGSRISPTAAPRSPGGNNLLSHFLR